MKKLITFSLWGEDPKYCVGALRNAELASELYPGWICRFYFTPLDGNDHFLSKNGILNQTIDRLLRMSNTDIIAVNEPPNWKGMFWRFLPASEDDVDVFISRDCDSRLSLREMTAVQEWLDSPRLIHVIRDHPFHTAPILGGLWGAKRNAIPDMKELIARWNKEDRWQTDQEFLRDVIWPQHYHKVLAHDDWNRFPGAVDSRFFPMPRDGNNFEGAIIGPNEERLHPEHHGLL